MIYYRSGYRNDPCLFKKNCFPFLNPWGIEKIKPRDQISDQYFRSCLQLTVILVNIRCKIKQRDTRFFSGGWTGCPLATNKLDFS
ncbi:MAG: hypothetical protein A2Y94_02180 [Caldithrix sp. RBG_13_44_9]|nr:MAG: hypothetical protein A2Y94_02180 [Caldithrix sp. RBG_13_44_9]